MKRYYLFIFLTFLCLTVHAQKTKNCSEEEFRAQKHGMTSLLNKVWQGMITELKSRQ